MSIYERTVVYVANAPYTVATGTKSAGGIAHKVKKKFKVEVMFITSSKVICKVVDGLKDKSPKNVIPPLEIMMDL